LNQDQANNGQNGPKNFRSHDCPATPDLSGVSSRNEGKFTTIRCCFEYEAGKDAAVRKITFGSGGGFARESTKGILDNTGAALVRFVGQGRDASMSASTPLSETKVDTTNL